MTTDTGSLWRRWDLHIHTPGAKLSDGYTGKAASEILDRYVDALEASPAHAFGITDYFSYEGYFSVVVRHREKYPQSTKVFFPNIEFRLSEAISKDSKNPHLHVIFDNDQEVCPRDKLARFLTTLKTHGQDKGGARISCLDLKSKHEEVAPEIRTGC
ncbi:MAG: hypothetical protein RBS99_07435 [Rhodospirillales bacterium]|jgi:hypothetical protein|nr:hypothetical protein [Rhodospirillales bacterium]